MNKRNLIAAAIGLAFGFAGAAIADTNTGTINQNGSSNSATIDQTVNVTYATSSINQNGNGNSAASSQSNTYGYPWVVNSSIDQGGNSNNASVWQDGSWIVTATVQQYGNGNGATISQTNYSGRSTAWVYQGGDGNSGSVTQNNAIDTSGTVWQYGGSSSSTGNVYQYAAFSSYALIDQFNVHQANAGIDQTGTNNNAQVHQSGTLGAGVNGYITQSGENNQATITQNRSIYGGNLADTATINQTGSFNIAAITESYVWSSTANIAQQYGSNNQATVVQLNLTEGHASIYQGGDANKGTINQGKDFAVCCDFGLYLSATLSQYGTSNTAQIDQSGWNQDAAILQSGNLNLASISQSNAGYPGGAVNHATINQIGNANNATVAQNGRGNNATINQH
jgi:hypothetical protein